MAENFRISDQNRISDSNATGERLLKDTIGEKLNSGQGAAASAGLEKQGLLPSLSIGGADSKPSTHGPMDRQSAPTPHAPTDRQPSPMSAPGVHPASEAPNANTPPQQDFMTQPRSPFARTQ